MEVAKFTPNINIPHFEEVIIIVFLADLQIENLLGNFVQSKTVSSGTNSSGAN